MKELDSIKHIYVDLSPPDPNQKTELWLLDESLTVNLVVPCSKKLQEEEADED